MMVMTIFVVKSSLLQNKEMKPIYEKKTIYGEQNHKLLHTLNT